MGETTWWRRLHSADYENLIGKISKRFVKKGSRLSKKDLG